MNMTGRFVLFVLLMMATTPALSQQKYWVTFTNKPDTSFDPPGYFDERAIAQRRQQQIPIYNSCDIPVSGSYISLVRTIADSVSYTSRWLNGIAVYASAAAVDEIKKLSCVAGVETMNNPSLMLSENEKNLFSFSKKEEALLKYQTDRLQEKKFKEKKIDGTGIRIAVFDAGFPGVDRHPAFEHLRKNKRIIATYDFVGRKEFVYNHHPHGTMVLSCIAGLRDSVNCGMATGAEFLLARTEMAGRENFSEEENWLAAAEWADQHGANIISSSLGYTNERYFNSDMNGKTSLVARAAAIAASKGILVINAAGNEGLGSWHFVDTPGDADSVLTVGGTDPFTDAHIYFSSFGPTSDGRMKPNVSSPADVIAANANGWSEVEGTSFSTPLVAGFAACVWQLSRRLTNMEVFHEIEKSSHLYPYFDYAHGYGIPQAGYFTGEKKINEPTFDFVIVNNDLKVILRERFSQAGTEEFLGYDTRRNLYYRIDDKNGVVRYYAAELAGEKEVLHYYISQFKPGDKISVSFEGYTSSYTITGNENPEGEIK